MEEDVRWVVTTRNYRGCTLIAEQGVNPAIRVCTDWKKRKAVTVFYFRALSLQLQATSLVCIWPGREAGLNGFIAGGS